MMTSRIIARSGCCQVRSKINTNTKDVISPGFINPWLLLVFFIAIAGVYVYCINSSAVKGYKIRQVESEISKLEKEREQLKIKEAELRSLYRIEQSSKVLNMAVPMEISYIEEKSPVAVK